MAAAATGILSLHQSWGLCHLGPRSMQPLTVLPGTKPPGSPPHYMLPSPAAGVHTVPPCSVPPHSMLPRAAWPRAKPRGSLPHNMPPRQGPHFERCCTGPSGQGLHPTTCRPSPAAMVHNVPPSVLCCPQQSHQRCAPQHATPLGPLAQCRATPYRAIPLRASRTAAFHAGPALGACSLSVTSWGRESGRPLGSDPSPGRTRHLLLQ